MKQLTLLAGLLLAVAGCQRDEPGDVPGTTRTVAAGGDASPDSVKNSDTALRVDTAWAETLDYRY